MKSPSVSYKMADGDQLIWPHSSGGFQDWHRDGVRPESCQLKQTLSTPSFFWSWCFNIVTETVRQIWQAHLCAYFLAHCSGASPGVSLPLALALAAFRHLPLGQEEDRDRESSQDKKRAARVEASTQREVKRDLSERTAQQNPPLMFLRSKQVMWLHVTVK